MLLISGHAAAIRGNKGACQCFVANRGGVDGGVGVTGLLYYSLLEREAARHDMLWSISNWMCVQRRVMLTV